MSVKMVVDGFFNMAHRAKIQIAGDFKDAQLRARRVNRLLLNKMLEFGIGRAMNVALCSLPNFTYPGDVSSGSRYFAQDIVSPPIEFVNGELELPETVGLGFEPDSELIKKFITSTYDAAF